MSQSDYIEKMMKEMNVREGGVLFNRFYLKKKLGEGTYGQVFKAVDFQDNSPVAIKLAFGNGSKKERNLIEAKILETLKETGSDVVVKMKTYFVMDECIVIVLELLAHDLIETIKNKVFNSFAKLSIYAKQMIEFLSLCESINLIHGDIKPDNILVQEKCHKIKFADFSLAHCPLVKHKLPKIQSLDYRAPEVLLGFNYTSSVDMWSVGCVLIECLTGEPFFREDDEMHLMQRIAEIFGTLYSDTIEQSKHTNKFFYYNDKYDQWVVRGFEEPIEPMGLTNFIGEYYPNIVINDECGMFIDLIEGMMRLYPEDRYTPEMCMNHPFFKLTCIISSD